MRNSLRGWTEVGVAGIVVLFGSVLLVGLGILSPADSALAVGEPYDLGITKLDSPDPVVAGQDITYTITATNNGDHTTGDATITDTLPAGTTFVSLTTDLACTTPAVGGSGTVSCTEAFDVGESHVLTLVVHTCPEVAASTIISNTATIALVGDPDTSNNTSTADSTVQTQSSLAITKTGTTQAGAESRAMYDIEVTNSGPSNSANTTVVDTLPDDFIALTAVPSQGSCSGLGTKTLTCNLGTLGAPNQCATSAAQMASIAITAHVRGAGAFTNTATVTSGNSLPDINAADNTATADTTVVVPVPVVGITGLVACVIILAAIGLVWLRKTRGRVDSAS
jgi:uncharacterized repeat protein (TIGR01451 family)